MKDLFETFKNWISKKENQKKVGLGALLGLGAVACYKAGKKSGKNEYFINKFYMISDEKIPKINENKLS